MPSKKKTKFFSIYVSFLVLRISVFVFSLCWLKFWPGFQIFVKNEPLFEHILEAIGGSNQTITNVMCIKFQSNQHTQLFLTQAFNFIPWRLDFSMKNAIVLANFRIRDQPWWFLCVSEKLQLALRGRGNCTVGWKETEIAISINPPFHCIHLGVSFCSTVVLLWRHVI